MEQLTFSIKGKTYVTEKITVGSVIDLWKMRNALSMGSYGQLFRHGMVASDNVLEAIDIEAFFTVFCPSFLKDLKPTSFGELGIDDFIEIRDVYLATIQPWVKSVEDMLRKKDKDGK